MRQTVLRHIRRGIALSGVLVLVLSAFSVNAKDAQDEVDELEEELEDIGEEIDDLEDEIDDLEGESSSLESELDDINAELLELAEEIDATEMQLEILESEIANTTASLEAAKQEEEEQYAAMKKRIKYIYEHGDASMVELLCSAEDMADFLNKAEFVESLSTYDRAALEELQAVTDQIEEESAALIADQESMEELQASLEEQQAELDAKAEETSTDIAAVNAAIAQAKEEKAAALEAEAEAKAAKEEAEAKAAEEAAAALSGISASVDDVTMLAALLQCEAGSSYEGMLAVATVVMNRVESDSFPNTLRGVICADGAFAPVWTGRLAKVIKNGPTSTAKQAAKDAIAGKRLSSVSKCYYFLSASTTDRTGVVVAGNVFFTSW